MAKLPNKKYLIRPGTKLSIGDIISEVHRFTGKYRHHKIIEIDIEGHAMTLECVASSDNGRVGATCFADIRAHTIHKNCTILSYKLPEINILFGPAAYGVKDETL